MSVALGAQELARLEEAVQQALVTGDERHLRVVGYGEITTVLHWTTGGRPVACKRLPGLADEAAFERYRSCVEKYIEQLAASGVAVPATAIQGVPCQGAWENLPTNGSVTAYCVQDIVPEGCFLPRKMAACGEGEAARIFQGVVELICATITDRVGLDAQLSNWAWERDQLWYVDISTPFLRDEQGREVFDVELHIASVPWALRGLMRALFLHPILDKYYTIRGTLIDILGNMYKERLDALVPAFVAIASQFASPPITVDEVRKYYSGDARLWALLQALRRADRWWQRRVRRRPYPFLLPPEIER